MASFNTVNAAKKAMKNYLERYDQNFINNYKPHISSFRTAFVELIRERIGVLPGIKKIKLQENTPAIVLSYELYGTINYRQEIIKRNGLKNPLQVPATQEIEVLNTDAINN